MLRAFKQRRKNERRNDGRIRFNYKHRRLLREFVPRDLLVWRCARVRTVGCCRIGDLAEIRPRLHGLLQVILDGRHHADWKIAADAAADLEKAHALALRQNFVVVVEI